LAFQLDGKAPADATIELALKSQENDRTTSLFMKSLDKGEPLEGRINFSIPPDIEPGDYNLLLSVNGVVNASWDLNIKE